MIPLYGNMSFRVRRPLSGLDLVTFIYMFGLYDLEDPYIG